MIHISIVLKTQILYIPIINTPILQHDIFIIILLLYIISIFNIGLNLEQSQNDIMI